MNNMLPCARFENLVVQELKDEVLVCDLKSNQVFCLNQTAGEVWKLCDGKTEVKDISQILSRKLKTNVSDEMVLFSLNELSKHDLLADKVSSEIIAGFSRREVIKQIGLSSMIALPLISSVVMPRAVHAASSCNNDSECAVGECCNTTINACNTAGSNGCICSSSGDCDSRCCTVNTGVCNDRDPFASCGGGVDCPAPFICCTDFNRGAIGDFNCSCDGRC